MSNESQIRANQSALQFERKTCLLLTTTIEIVGAQSHHARILNHTATYHGLTNTITLSHIESLK